MVTYLWLKPKSFPVILYPLDERFHLYLFCKSWVPAQVGYTVEKFIMHKPDNA